MQAQTGIAFEDSSENKLLPWVVCFSAALFFFFEFMQMVILNSMTANLLREFDLSAKQMGTLTFAYFWGNVAFLFPAGMIIDRVSTRRLILFTLSICVLGAFGFAMASNITWAIVCRFIIGMGGAFCFLSNVRLASRWFPPERLALVIGLIVTIAMLGGMVAQAPFALLIEKVGWRNASLVSASVGLLILINIFIFVRDFPKGKAQMYYQQHAVLQTMGFFETLKKSLGNAQNWLAGSFALMMNIPVMVLGAAWGILYLVQVHHLSEGEAAWISGLIFLGAVIGSPFWGWLSDRIGLRKKPMLYAAIASLAIALIIMLVPGLSRLAFMVLFFGLGFFMIAHILAYPLIAESNSRALTATSESVASLLIQSGGFFAFVFGFLMDLNWNHTIIDGNRVYSSSDFMLAMSILPIAFFFSWIVALFIRETHCRSVEE